jgi:hypothetical protein
MALQGTGGPQWRLRCAAVDTAGRNAVHFRRRLHVATLDAPALPAAGGPGGNALLPANPNEDGEVSGAISGLR